MTKEELKMWCDDVDYVIATTPRQATKLWEGTIGEARSDHNFTDDDWEEVPADMSLTVTCGLVLSGREFAEQKVTKTAAEWCAAFGAGFLCSLEY